MGAASSQSVGVQRGCPTAAFLTVTTPGGTHSATTSTAVAASSSPSAQKTMYGRGVPGGRRCHMRTANTVSASVLVYSMLTGAVVDATIRNIMSGPRGLSAKIGGLNTAGSGSGVTTFPPMQCPAGKHFGLGCAPRYRRRDTLCGWCRQQYGESKFLLAGDKVLLDGEPATFVAAGPDGYALVTAAGTVTVPRADVRARLRISRGGLPGGVASEYVDYIPPPPGGDENSAITAVRAVT